METLTNALITLAIGGIIGGIVKSLLDYRNQVFAQLWNERLNAYRKLFMIMKQFPLWPRLDDVTYINLYEMSIAMRNWYFDTGGILMSKKTRIVYGELQEIINNRILVNNKVDNTLVKTDEYDAIQKICSTVRTEMTNDLLSRGKLI